MSAMDAGVTGAQVSPLEGVLLVDLVFGFLLFWPFVGLFLVVACRNPAPGLARRADLPLPPAMDRKLDNFLFVRRVVYAFAVLAVSQGVLFVLVLAEGDRRGGHVAELALLPAQAWLPCMLASLWPRWKSNGEVHLAHLRRLGVRDALSDPEWATVAAAYCGSGVLITWAMSRTGLTIWSAVAVVSLACQALVTYAIARRVMARPAVGSDNLELAWDDVLRLERVRSLVASSSFVTLWFVVGAAGDLAGVALFGSPVIVTLLAGVAGVAIGVWQRSPAHRNWRRAWPSELPLGGYHRPDDPVRAHRRGRYAADGGRLARPPRPHGRTRVPHAPGGRPDGPGPGP